jgi:hypothetical protein
MKLAMAFTVFFVLACFPGTAAASGTAARSSACNGSFGNSIAPSASSGFQIESADPNGTKLVGWSCSESSSGGVTTWTINLCFSGTDITLEYADSSVLGFSGSAIGSDWSFTTTTQANLCGSYSGTILTVSGEDVGTANADGYGFIFIPYEQYTGDSLGFLLGVS